MTPEDAMRRALAAGVEARGWSSPNPPVGAVVLDRYGDPAGVGHTQPPGQAHAEVMALRAAGDRAHGGTLVCTLEPCAHTGRTGPCTDAIAAAGVARVVYAVPEPTRTAGGGQEHLEQRGIAVTAGVLRAEAERGALRAWLHAQATGRPWVTLKSGQSLDGQVAAEDGSSRWITGPEARADAHEERARLDAILVGAGTVRDDDPALTARTPEGAPRDRQPLRVVVSNSGRIPPTARVLDGAVPTLVAVGQATETAIAALDRPGVEVLRAPDPQGGVDLDVVLVALRERGALHILCEGGPRLAGSFVGADRVDEVVAYVAPMLLVSGLWPALRGYGVSTVAEAVRLTFDEVTTVGPDLRITATRAPGPTHPAGS